MTAITVRDVPSATRDELAARAARSGKSLQEYLRNQLIQLAAKPDVAEWVAAVQDRKRTYPTNISTEQILEFRDADRR